MWVLSLPQLLQGCYSWQLSKQLLSEIHDAIIIFFFLRNLVLMELLGKDAKGPSFCRVFVQHLLLHLMHRGHTAIQVCMLHTTAMLIIEKRN